MGANSVRGDGACTGIEADESFGAALASDPAGSTYESENTRLDAVAAA
jgi:hypothetical protein